MVTPRRLWFFGLASSLISVAAAVDAAEPAVSIPSPMLGSSVFDWDQLVVKSTPVGARRAVADNPTATLERFECHVTTLNPGKASHAPHQHAREEFIILKEGTLDVGINGAVQRVGPGSLFFFAANDGHNVTNVGRSDGGGRRGQGSDGVRGPTGSGSDGVGSDGVRPSIVVFPRLKGALGARRDDGIHAQSFAPPAIPP